MPRPATKAKSLRTTKPSKREPGKPSQRVILSLVIRYDNPGQLTVPNQLNFGDDGKLYLTRSGEPENPKAKPQPITLKESVAWFRVGNDCHLSLTQGDSFSEWLKRIEQALP